MKSKTTRHGLKRMTALLLALVLCMGMMPSAFAAQQVSHARVAFAEHINIFLAHYSLPPVINFG